MHILSSARFFRPSAAATALSAGPILVMAGEALAHETGAPHGAAEHLALYAGVAALLGLAGYAILRLTQQRAERRVRVERDDPRRRPPRR